MYGLGVEDCYLLALQRYSQPFYFRRTVLERSPVQVKYTGPVVSDLPAPVLILVLKRILDENSALEVS